MRIPAPLPITRRDDVLTFPDPDADGRAQTTTPPESANSSSPATRSLAGPPPYRDDDGGRPARHRRAAPVQADPRRHARRRSPADRGVHPGGVAVAEDYQGAVAGAVARNQVSLRLSGLGRVKRARRYSRANQRPEAASGSQSLPAGPRASGEAAESQNGGPKRSSRRSASWPGSRPPRRRQH